MLLETAANLHLPYMTFKAVKGFYEPCLLRLMTLVFMISSEGPTDLQPEVEFKPTT